MPNTTLPKVPNRKWCSVLQYLNIVSKQIHWKKKKTDIMYCLTQTHHKPTNLLKDFLLQRPAQCRGLLHKTSTVPRFLPPYGNSLRFNLTVGYSLTNCNVLFFLEENRILLKIWPERLCQGAKCQVPEPDPSMKDPARGKREVGGRRVYKQKIVPVYSKEAGGEQMEQTAQTRRERSTRIHLLLKGFLGKEEERGTKTPPPPISYLIVNRHLPAALRPPFC